MGLDMTTDRVFVLLMMVLLMMAGCFEATSTTEAQEEQDSTSGDDGTPDNVPNDDSDDDTSSPNNSVDSSNGQDSNSEETETSTTNSQERTWYSSGGVSIEAWNDGQNLGTNNERCIEWGPQYDSSTGEYIGEVCVNYNVPQTPSDWNTTMCTDYGGELLWNSTTQSYGDYRNAAQCRIIFNTINTTSGEALLIYQASDFSFRSTCMGISVPTNYYSAGGWSSSSMSTAYSVSDEYNIVANSAFDCTHELYRTIPFTSNLEPDEYLWSIVYAIQDTTVV